MRLLLVEDHPDLAAALARALGQSGFAVEAAASGERADQLLLTEQFSVVVLDISLPGMDGWEVLRRLRSRGNAVPVLILTAHGTTQDRVRGLNMGADDYLGKPFDLVEVEPRVRALVRRSHGHETGIIQFGSLRLDTIHRAFELAGAPLALTKRERAVLEVLMMRNGRAIGKEALAAQVFRLEEDVGVDAVEVYVHRVRKKLAGTDVAIASARGLGYLLELRPAGPP